MTEPAGSQDVRAVFNRVVGENVMSRVSDEDLLFEERIVDSLYLVEMIEQLERRFGFEIAGEDLTPENFESIAAIARFVQRRGVA